MIKLNGLEAIQKIRRQLVGEAKYLVFMAVVVSTSKNNKLAQRSILNSTLLVTPKNSNI